VTCTYVYPLYASFKSIKASQADQTETWLMYWCCIGVLCVAETTVEWTVNWFVTP
jgi:receptor expression-enhancing protein 1/2/3/4